MTENNRHKSLLRFIRRVVDVPLGHSKEDLHAFLDVASREYPYLVPLIEEYLKLAERSDTDVAFRRLARRPMPKRRSAAGQMHLFDLLREQQLFPSNADLSEFAGRVLRDIRRHRFDKMSRGDIAARIVEYLETLDPGTRRELERSMREAMSSSPGKDADRKSFFSTWEKIIKGIEL